MKKIDFKKIGGVDFIKYVNKKYNYTVDYGNWQNLPYELQLTILQEYVREERHVLITVYNNASGYLWAMSMTYGGADLGWCNCNGNSFGGSWKGYYEALQNAIEVEFSNDGLKAFEKYRSKLKDVMVHCSMYSNWCVNNKTIEDDK